MKCKHQVPTKKALVYSQSKYLLGKYRLNNRGILPGLLNTVKYKRNSFWQNPTTRQIIATMEEETTTAIKSSN